MMNIGVWTLNKKLSEDLVNQANPVKEIPTKISR